MPIQMRIGKVRGSTSKDAMPVGPFRTETVPVNVRDLDRFEAGDEVTPESLVEKRLIKNTKIDVKLLGMGEVAKKLTVSRARASRRPRARRSRPRAARSSCCASRRCTSGGIKGGAAKAAADRGAGGGRRRRPTTAEAKRPSASEA